MELSKDNIETPNLPFNNLYLISGLVNGFNKGWMYLTTVLLLIIGYLLFQSIIFYPLINILKQNGYSETDILSNARITRNAIQVFGLNRNQPKISNCRFFEKLPMSIFLRTLFKSFF